MNSGSQADDLIDTAAPVAGAGFGRTWRSIVFAPVGFALTDNVRVGATIRVGEPFTLVLTGPAGGTYSGGTGGEELTCDAVEFCRILSGRGTGTGLLAQPVPF